MVIIPSAARMPNADLALMTTGEVSVIGSFSIVVCLPRVEYVPFVLHEYHSYLNVHDWESNLVTL